jgi:hypothetical protein
LHIYSNSTNNYDWRKTKDDNLWGNGVEIGTATSANSGVYYNSNYYQSQIWNSVNNYDFDPCKKHTEGGNWRLPTQDELERLANYECNPTSAASGWTPNIDGNNGSNTGSSHIIWVPVKNGRPDLSSWAATSTNYGGYAVYTKSDWSLAKSYTDADAGHRLYDDACPASPVLFLPAAGYRYNGSGSLSYAGTLGYYWSSTPYGTAARHLTFGGTYVRPYSDSHRATGFSVRCVAE